MARVLIPPRPFLQFNYIFVSIRVSRVGLSIRVKVIDVDVDVVK